MLKIKETKLTNIKKNKFEEITITFHIKKEDYSEQDEKLLYELYRNWNYWVLVFQDVEFNDNTWKSDKEIKSKKLQHLVLLMEQYKDKEWTSIEELKKQMYLKYWIQSRTELTIEQLEKEIESYKFWLYDN